MTAIELRAELFREMSPLLDNESAMTKMLAFVKSLVPAKKTKTESDWANRFVGAWKDSRSAEEIISDIRESRRHRASAWSWSPACHHNDEWGESHPSGYLRVWKGL